MPVDRTCCCGFIRRGTTEVVPTVIPTVGSAIAEHGSERTGMGHVYLLLLLSLPVSTTVIAQDQQVDSLPDAAFLEFLGSYDQPEEELFALALDAIEDETEQPQAVHHVPAKDHSHEKN